MKKTISFISFLALFSQASFAQVDEFLDEQIVTESEQKKRAEEELKAKEAAERLKAEQAKALEQQKLAQDKRLLDAKAREMEGLRESKADSIEYTLNPSSVELMVEMDPSNYGFRSRNHRMVLGTDFDLLMRGRGMIRYDYRFFDHLSMGLMAGIDWTDMSLFSRFSDKLAKPTPKQFSVLGGVSAKWRLTEWYMHSSIFLEPSVLFGHMWQDFALIKSSHWRLRPGIFLGGETVFDSGLSLTLRAGAEFPADFGTPNPLVELVEPLFVVGFGLAI